MPAFFDPSLIEKWGVAFIREDKVEDALRKLIPGARITKGQYSYPGRSELRDLVWNHMDQNHRPYIHRTYGAASRIFVGNHATFSLTRFGGWPFLIPVFDGYFKENGFYQILVLFGLVIVINVIECNSEGDATRMDVGWVIASHRWLRFLHPFLSRRLTRLNDVQNREDDAIRDRRIALRAAGYRFKTDAPNFMNSNVMENNTIFPAMATAVGVPVRDLPDQQAIEVAVADRAFIMRRDDEVVDVWPGVCPHEGASLTRADLRGKTVKCPWHGLEFPGRRLVEGGPGITLCGTRLELAGGAIAVTPAISPLNAVE
jgi:hypothetical protein